MHRTCWAPDTLRGFSFQHIAMVQERRTTRIKNVLKGLRLQKDNASRFARRGLGFEFRVCSAVLLGLNVGRCAGIHQANVIDCPKRSNQHTQFTTHNAQPTSHNALTNNALTQERAAAEATTRSRVHPGHLPQTISHFTFRTSHLIRTCSGSRFESASVTHSYSRSQ
jgi:hypothetical protein